MLNIYRRCAIPILLLLAVASAHAAPDIHRFTSTNVKTLSLTSEITTENRAALKTISGDIALAYRLHRGSMAYEQPGKLRVETTVGRLSGYYVINGNRRLTSVPFLHMHKVGDVTNAPGKKNSLLDFGLLPPEYLDEWNATFLRKDGTAYVYQLQPKQKGETMKDIVWIDPQTHITFRRLNYDRDGKLVKSFVYAAPVQAAPGIWIPTRVELYNPQNKLAGVTVYRNVKVNQPLSPSVFSI